jgi:hypothetical protein
MKIHNLPEAYNEILAIVSLNIKMVNYIILILLILETPIRYLVIMTLAAI